MKRPNLIDIKTAKELRQWYWLKQELVDYCKLLKVSYSGSKEEITDRLAALLEKDILTTKKSIQKTKITSTFNWATEHLTPETIITDSYKNSQNVRQFFQDYIGSKFKFNIDFMNWMKANCGKNLKEAASQWQILEDRKKDKNFKSTIPNSNQYNQYMRDFFADNPNKTIQDARQYWQLKRSLPGHNRYEKADLNLK